jgi:DsbC/DsbD-like thiol-disulfide interchange protein
MKSLGLLGLALVLATTSSVSAAVGGWEKGQRAEVRLIASGVGSDGKLAAGIEIVVPSGWHTYWRSPGDAGVVPLIDFSQSKNLGPAEVSFPVPERLDDGFAVTNIYEGRVVLPVSAVVTDPSKPIDLVAKLTIGVCEDVCISDDVDVRLTIPSGESDSTAAGMLTTARALVPGPPQPGVFAIEKVTRIGGTENRPVFRFDGIVPAAAGASVFVEAADWAPYTPDLVAGESGKTAYTIEFSRRGSAIPIASAKFRLTILSGKRAIDQTLGLD